MRCAKFFITLNIFEGINYFLVFQTSPEVSIQGTSVRHDDFFTLLSILEGTIDTN